MASLGMIFVEHDFGTVELERSKALLGSVEDQAEADEVTPEGEAPGKIRDREFGHEPVRGVVHGKRLR